MTASIRLIGLLKPGAGRAALWLSPARSVVRQRLARSLIVAQATRNDRSRVGRPNTPRGRRRIRGHMKSGSATLRRAALLACLLVWQTAPASASPIQITFGFPLTYQ